MTGFYFWDRPSHWQFPEILKAFLHGDKPIVAVTAGSVAPEERALFLSYYQTSIESILARGARALVINAPEDAIFPERREEMVHLPFAPFSARFPAFAAVILHRRVGTNAQSLRARAPCLLVPGRVGQHFHPAP